MRELIAPINRAKSIVKTKLFVRLAVFIPLLILVVVAGHSEKIPALKNTPPSSSQVKQTNNSQVLGANAQRPQIYISSYGDGFAEGGVIELASTDEPAIQVGGYNIKGTAEIGLYLSNDDALLDYLTHDDKGNQTKRTPDINKIHYVTTVKKDIYNQGTKVTLPLSDKGIWYVTIKVGSITANAFIIRSNIGVLAKEGNNELIFWGQNFKTKKSISDGVIIPYNLQNGRRELGRAQIGSDGTATFPLTQDADVALFAQNDERALIPLNVKYLNASYTYKSFHEKVKKTRYFIFTDRSLYKPGDTVNFKAILRDDDDARYTSSTGNASVQIYNGYYYEGATNNPQPIFDNTYAVSSDGTINGSYQIPTDEKVGYHTLAVTIPNQPNTNNYYDGDYSPNTISFDVEYFKKPEATIDVTAPQTELIAGDKSSFKIAGRYYSGQPLINQKVKYTITSSDIYEYQYLQEQQSLGKNISDDYRYGTWYINNNTKSGTVTLDKNGEAEIDLDTNIAFAKGKTQIFAIEATLDDGSQEPAFSRKNILVYAGDFGIYRKDYTYGSKVNTLFDLPLSLVAYRATGNVANVGLTAKIHRENWIAYQTSDSKYPSYKKEEEDLPSVTTTTDGSGNATIHFTPTKVGSYTITVQGKDARGNLVTKVFYTYVSSQDYAYYNQYGNNDLTVSLDKQKYQPTDTVNLSINSYVPDRDVFVSMERGRVDRYQVVHLQGKNGTASIPLTASDMPNMYAKVSSFDDNSLNDAQIDIPVSAESKRIEVKVTPNSKRFGPGETATLNVETTDTAGNPISADVAVWTVDKAIFALSENNLGDIFNTFWQERYDNTQETHSLQGILVLQGGGRGGCFVEGTKVLMSDGKSKNIENVKSGDYILTRSSSTDGHLVKAKVVNTEKAEDGSYLIINRSLKVTADHILWVNNAWKEAGSIQVGDTLIDTKGKKVFVTSIEWQRAKAAVYNLQIENYHTYFADGIWVHNDKGIDRVDFKDTAYWNPSIHTDSTGRAQISFKLPDNLTTWTIAAVAATSDTQVGQTTNEIVVSKDVIVRPILPNIMRLGDEMVVSALVQNFTNTDQQFAVGLTFDSGNVDPTSTTNMQIKSNEIKQVYWKVKPTQINDHGKLVFSARSLSDNNAADVVTQEIPVRAFEFEDKRSSTGEGNKNYTVKLDSTINKEKSTITLSLSSNMLGMLPTAMKYLIDYPYGCVEQTTSRFVPAVIAKTNSQYYATALADKNIDDIIKKGISKLTTQQQYDGGWTWWFSGQSDPFITAYVVEYLMEAKQAGATVDANVLKQAQNYLEQDTDYNVKTKQQETIKLQDKIARMYGLTLLGDTARIQKITDFRFLSPDMLSLAVIVNYRSGDTNPHTNGLEKLMSMAHVQGDGIYWDAGNKVNFGSKDASTALAIQAILIANGNRELVTKGARYLTRNRKYDYWSNTYATAQVVRALTEFSKTNNESNPSYSYTVSVDGKEIDSGLVNGSQQFIPDISIPASSIKQGGSVVSIKKTGQGQLYSTLVINAFNTDTHATAVDHGLQVKREYVNEKGEEYSLGVGDIAIVKVTVSGLKADENYASIVDELPAGLVPINESFKNEQYNQNPYSYYYNSYDITDRDITENGEVLSLYQIHAGERTYTYRARIVSEGTFVIPPVTASLMYAPEIYGRSDAQTIHIDEKSHLLPSAAVKKTVKNNGKMLLSIIPLFAVIGVVLLILKRQGVTVGQVKELLSEILSKAKSKILQMRKRQK